MKVSTKTVITLTGSDVFQAIADYVEKHGQVLDLKAIEEELCEAVDGTDEYHFVSHADAEPAKLKKPARKKSKQPDEPAKAETTPAPTVPVKPTTANATQEPAGTTADAEQPDMPFELPPKASPAEVTKPQAKQSKPAAGNSPGPTSAPPKSIAVGSLFKKP